MNQENGKDSEKTVSEHRKIKDSKPVKCIPIAIKAIALCAAAIVSGYLAWVDILFVAGDLKWIMIEEMIKVLVAIGVAAFIIVKAIGAVVDATMAVMEFWQKFSE